MKDASRVDEIVEQIRERAQARTGAAEHSDDAGPVTGRRRVAAGLHLMFALPARAMRELGATLRSRVLLERDVARVASGIMRLQQRIDELAASVHALSERFAALEERGEADPSADEPREG